jgi:MFS transporter, FHS family, Na+ dependent glucose transporter 1
VPLPRRKFRWPPATSVTLGAMTTRRITPAVVYFGLFVVLGLSLSLLGPALDHFRDITGSTKAQIGWLFTAQSIGYLLGSVASGRWVDGGHGHRLCQLSLSSSLIGIVVASQMQTRVGLAVAFAVVGAGCGGLDVAGNTLLAWSEPVSLVRSMNALHLSFGVGAFTVPLLVKWSLDINNELVVATAIIVGLGMLIVVGLQRPTPVRPQHRIDHADDAGATAWTPLLMVGAFFLVLVGVETSVAGWIATYVNDQSWSGGDQGPLLTAVFFGAFTIGRVITALMGTRVTPRITLAVTGVLSIVGAAIFVVASGGELGVWLAVIVIGAANGPQYPLMMTFADDRLHLTGRATSVFVGSSAIGGISIPLFIGWLFDAQGNGSFPVTVLVTTIILMACIVMVDRYVKGTFPAPANV